VLIVLVAIPVALWAGSVILLLRKVRELREQWTAFHERLRALVGLVVVIAIVCLALVLWQLWNPLMTTMFCLVILQIIVWLLCGWVYCPLTKLHELRCALRARSNARSCRE
jgi:amino acid transporter